MLGVERMHQMAMKLAQEERRKPSTSVLNSYARSDNGAKLGAQARPADKSLPRS